MEMLLTFLLGVAIGVIIVLMIGSFKPVVGVSMFAPAPPVSFKELTDEDKLLVAVGLAQPLDVPPPSVMDPPPATPPPPVLDAPQQGPASAQPMSDAVMSTQTSAPPTGPAYQDISASPPPAPPPPK